MQYLFLQTYLTCELVYILHAVYSVLVQKLPVHSEYREFNVLHHYYMLESLRILSLYAVPVIYKC